VQRDLDRSGVDRFTLGSGERNGRMNLKLIIESKGSTIFRQIAEAELKTGCAGLIQPPRVASERQ
jgi:hypothetical protein